MDRVRESLALDEQLDGSGVTVAVLDTGVDAAHPDLTVGINEAICLTNTLDDRIGHGTHVAGIIAGSGVASAGRYRGIAPGVELASLKVKASIHDRLDHVLAGVQRAVDLGADIINYSGGSRGPYLPPWKWPSRKSSVELLFERVVDRGVLCVCAAGNYGDEHGSIVQPGIFESVLTVGALDETGTVAKRSSRGPVYLDDSLPVGGAVRHGGPLIETDLRTRAKPDCVVYAWWESELRWLGPISARSSEAEGLYAVDPRDQHGLYAPMPGTSQAAAIVSGLAALLIQAGEQLDFDWGPNRAVAVKRILIDSARKIRGLDAGAQGAGQLLWPTILATLIDCNASEVRRRSVIAGPQLRRE